MTSYTADQDRILMETSGGPVRLTLEQAERLLDIYDEADAVREFNALYTAAQRVPGFIPRGCSGGDFASRGQPCADAQTRSHAMLHSGGGRV